MVEKITYQTLLSGLYKEKLNLFGLDRSCIVMKREYNNYSNDAKYTPHFNHYRLIINLLYCVSEYKFS